MLRQPKLQRNLCKDQIDVGNNNRFILFRFTTIEFKAGHYLFTSLSSIPLPCWIDSCFNECKQCSLICTWNE